MGGQRRLVLALPAVLVATWWIASDGSDTLYFPPLRTILQVLPDPWLAGGADSRLVADVLPSLGRLAGGYLLAAVVGVTIGVLIGRRPWLRALVEPVIEMFRAIPPPVVVPVLVALAGIDNTIKVLVIVFGCVWPIMLNTVEGVRALDPVAEETCRCYGVRGLSRLRVLVLPAASPQIVTGLRQSLSIAVILMVISEMVVATNGLGFTVVQFQRTFALPEMWTGDHRAGARGGGAVPALPPGRSQGARLVRGPAQGAPRPVLTAGARPASVRPLGAGGRPGRHELSQTAPMADDLVL